MKFLVQFEKNNQKYESILNEAQIISWCAFHPEMKAYNMGFLLIPLQIVRIRKNKDMEIHINENGKELISGTVLV